MNLRYRLAALAAACTIFVVLRWIAPDWLAAIVALWIASFVALIGETKAGIIAAANDPRAGDPAVVASIEWTDSGSHGHRG